MSTDIKLDQNVKKQSLCDSCKSDKMKRKSSRRSQNSVFEKNECFDFDLMRSFELSAHEEYKYIDLLICKAIEKFFIYLLKSIDE